MDAEIAKVLNVTGKLLPTCSLSNPKNEHVAFARNPQAALGLKKEVDRLYLLVRNIYPLRDWVTQIEVQDPEWTWAVYHNHVFENVERDYPPDREGRNCVTDRGAVIGAVGLKIVQDRTLTRKVWVHHTGNVVLGDEVYVGPQSTIHRAVLDSTVIGDRVIIGSFCNVGHNVRIGADTILTVGVAVGGSAVIGKHCFIGMNTTILNGVEICDHVLVGAGSVVTRNLPEPGTYFGSPAKYRGTWDGRW